MQFDYISFNKPRRFDFQGIFSVQNDFDVSHLPPAVRFFTKPQPLKVSVYTSLCIRRDRGDPCPAAPECRPYDCMRSYAKSFGTEPAAARTDVSLSRTFECGVVTVREKTRNPNALLAMCSLNALKNVQT